nr:DUF4258 domain-containing protein [Aphanizomenon flos-aquae]
MTVHAQQVITAREIQLEWVARVLAEPQKTEPDREDPELRHALARIPENGNRVLRVVYNPHSAPPSVTIGNFGFLNTFDDNFDTKLSKS